MKRKREGRKADGELRKRGNIGERFLDLDVLGIIFTFVIGSENSEVTKGIAFALSLVCREWKRAVVKIGCGGLKATHLLPAAAFFGSRDLCDLAIDFGARNLDEMFIGAATGGHVRLCMEAHDLGRVRKGLICDVLSRYRRALIGAISGGHLGACNVVFGHLKCLNLSRVNWDIPFVFEDDFLSAVSRDDIDMCEFFLEFSRYRARGLLSGLMGSIRPSRSVFSGRKPANSLALSHYNSNWTQIDLKPGTAAPAFELACSSGSFRACEWLLRVIFNRSGKAEYSQRSKSVAKLILQGLDVAAHENVEKIMEIVESIAPHTVRTLVLPLFF